MRRRTDLTRALIPILLAGLSLAAMLGLPGRVEASMAEGASNSRLLVVAIGLAIGCYGTIAGIGGGPIIMPVLFELYGWKSESLVATCLFIVFLNALSGSIGYAQQRRIDYRGGIQFALAAVPGAMLVGLYHHLVGIPSFHIVFGVFLVVLAGYALVNLNTVDQKRPPPPATVDHYRRVVLRDSSGTTFDFHANDRVGIYANLILGAFVGLLGIGGGVFQVPVLLYLLRYPAHVATATSHFTTMITCGAALLPHLLLGNVHYAEASWMGLGVIVGAQVGARLARRTSSRGIVLLYIGILILFALRMFAHVNDEDPTMMRTEGQVQEPATVELLSGEGREAGPG